MRRTGRPFRELVPLLWVAWVDDVLTALGSSSPRLRRSKGGITYIGHWIGQCLRPLALSPSCPLSSL